MVFGTGGDSSASGFVVVDYPDARRRWQVGRGSRCLWSADGGELLCAGPDLAIVAMKVRNRASSFEWEAPERLFRLPGIWLEGDGRRFLTYESPAGERASVDSFETILNWEALVGRR